MVFVQGAMGHIIIAPPWNVNPQFSPGVISICSALSGATPCSAGSGIATPHSRWRGQSIRDCTRQPAGIMREAARTGRSKP